METGIGTLRAGPSHMTTTINGLPPDDGEIYYGPGTVIPLFDETGQQIGQIVEISHEIHNEIECPDDCRPFMEVGVLEDDGTGLNQPEALVINKNKLRFAIPSGSGGSGQVGDRDAVITPPGGCMP